MELYLYFHYMSPLNVLSGAEVKNEWSYTSTVPYMSPLNVLSSAEVKNEWSYTSSPPDLRSS